jgi:hypothetical protein
MHMGYFTPGADYKFKEGFLVTAGSLQKGVSKKAEGKAATQMIYCLKRFFVFFAAHVDSQRFLNIPSMSHTRAVDSKLRRCVLDSSPLAFTRQTLWGKGH